MTHRRYRNLALIEQVLKTIRHYDMARRGDRIVATVSGGPDSVFLLCALDRLRTKLGIDLAVAHLDHGLRGVESERDARFVADLARSMGLGCLQKSVDLRARRKKDRSTEEAGREERYAFFRHCAHRIGAKVIATGHTLDDQAETVLMRIVKGASIKGASGIPPVRAEGSALTVIRPLIEIEKSDIVRFLDANAVPYRIDATNRDDAYFRNRVRHEIIPFLERYNPRIKRALSNFAGHLREDVSFISNEKARRSAGIVSGRTGSLSLDLKKIAIQPRALVKEIVRDALEEAGADLKKLSYKHWKEIEAVVRHKRKGDSLDLPGGVRMTRGDTHLLLFQRKD